MYPYLFSERNERRVEVLEGVQKICAPYLWSLIFCYLCTWKARDKQFMVYQLEK